MGAVSDCMSLSVQNHVDAVLLKGVQKGLGWPTKTRDWAIEEVPIHPSHLLSLHKLDVFGNLELNALAP